MGWVKQLGMRSGLAHRFIAGENVDEVLAVVRSLHDTGVMTTLNLLGGKFKAGRRRTGRCALTWNSSGPLTGPA